MSHRSILACLSLFVLVAAGCNRGADKSQSDQSPAAAIGSGGKDSSKPADDNGPALKKSNADSRHPEMLIETSMGNITLKLDREKAPGTVDNFLFYAASGYYNGTVVHQVFKDQGILAGGYNENLVEKAPIQPPIRNEADNGLKNLRGTIAMNRQPDNMDSATSQFFINVVDSPSLDYKDRSPAGYGYCVFGNVTAGMDVVNRINMVALRDTSNFERTPAEPIVIKSVQRLR